MSTTLDEVRRHFEDHEPLLSEIRFDSRAAVALVIREEVEDLSLLFIERAQMEGDRWSGHIAFPGGRLDPEDTGPREAAERETLEEVGLDLECGETIGRLDDLMGTAESILISGFVYAVPPGTLLTLNYEVEQAFWLSLRELEDPRRHSERSFRYLDQDLFIPAIQVLGEDAPVLWGLSYRFLELFMNRIGRSIPGMRWREDL